METLQHPPQQLENGEVYSTGANNSGQLGIGKVSPFTSKPTKVPTFTAILLFYGFAYAIILGVLLPLLLLLLLFWQIMYKGPPIKHVSCGSEFSALIDVKGQ